MEWFDIQLQYMAPTPLPYAGVNQFRFKGIKKFILSQP